MNPVKARRKAMYLPDQGWAKYFHNLDPVSRTSLVSILRY